MLHWIPRMHIQYLGKPRAKDFNRHMLIGILSNRWDYQNPFDESCELLFKAHSILNIYTGGYEKWLHSFCVNCMLQIISEIYQVIWNYYLKIHYIHYSWSVYICYKSFFFNLYRLHILFYLEAFNQTWLCQPHCIL